LPPENTSRKYVVAKVRPLLLQKEDKLEFDVSYPPSPGSGVFLLSEKELEEIFSKSSEENLLKFGRLIGYTNLYGVLKVKEFSKHIGIIGTTGSGKSYTTICLLNQITKLPASGAILVFDIHGDYKGFEEHYASYKEINSIEEGKFIRFIPPKSWRDEKGGVPSYLIPLYINLDLLDDYEFLSRIIITFKKGEISAEERMQVLYLARILQKIKEIKGGINMLFTDTGRELFDKLRDLLDVPGDKEKRKDWKRRMREYFNDELISLAESIHSATRRAIFSSLDIFRKTIYENYELLITPQQEGRHDKQKLLTKEENIKKFIRENYFLLFDFSRYEIEEDVQQFVVAFLARIFYETLKKLRKEEKREDIRLYFVLEEAQHFIPDKSFKSYALSKDTFSLISTQGRKFGFCLIIITQRPAFVDPAVISMLNSFIIHRISYADLSFVDRVTGGLPSWIKDRLTNLRTGRCILMGQFIPLPFPIIVDIDPKAFAKTEKGDEIPHRPGV